ncbi:MAG: hypothetical protein D8M58_19915 [Calditrichaeota bacterium]|nr:MAG: hypothetical protein DWQ03_14660 [Calditrichota bacterium]MBL1207677.1 hypothetical protein [Calditrichota bacterium]NOG47511.1 hypothetical protein [Calditrichota bacterium]
MKNHNPPICNWDEKANCQSILFTAIIFLLLYSLAFSQNIQLDSTSVQTEKKHFIGSSLFLLGNFVPGDPPNYFQLNYGYQITPKDFILVEAITWTYYEPLGTYGSSDDLYPGKIRAIGVGLGYQHFYWKGLYNTIEATPFLQQFYDSENQKTQKGFQLYLQLIMGYRFEFFEKRFFIEPAYALKYWPVNTNFPKTFADIERGKPKHIFEPSFHFGFRF